MNRFLYLNLAAALLFTVAFVGCPNEPSLDVSPAIRTVEAPAGTTTFTVSMGGAGVVAWTPTVTSGEEWLHIDNADSNTLTVSFDTNATPDQRQGQISIDAGDVEGSPAVVTVLQNGVSGQDDADLVGSWVGYWWINGIEQDLDIDWTFNANGTWTVAIPDAPFTAGGTYVVDTSAEPFLIDAYVTTASAPGMTGFTVGDTTRGYYAIDGNTMYRSQMFATRPAWEDNLLNPAESPAVFVAERQ